MYENSCSYQTALDLKCVSPPAIPQVKTEGCLSLGQCSPDWTSYRFHQSTFEQLKQSVEKAKAALQDRSSFFGATSAFRYKIQLLHNHYYTHLFIILYLYRISLIISFRFPFIRLIYIVLVIFMRHRV